MKEPLVRKRFKTTACDNHGPTEFVNTSRLSKGCEFTAIYILVLETVHRHWMIRRSNSILDTTMFLDFPRLLAYKQQAVKFQFQVFDTRRLIKDRLCEHVILSIWSHRMLFLTSIFMLACNVPWKFLLSLLKQWSCCNGSLTYWHDKMFRHTILTIIRIENDKFGFADGKFTDN